jgi:hypothetical protein
MTFGDSFLEQQLGTPARCDCGRQYHPDVDYDGNSRRGHPRRWCSKTCRDRATWLRRTGRLWNNPNLP